MNSADIIQAEINAVDEEIKELRSPFEGDIRKVQADLDLVVEALGHYRTRENWEKDRKLPTPHERYGRLFFMEWDKLQKEKERLENKEERLADERKQLQDFLLKKKNFLLDQWIKAKQEESAKPPLPPVLDRKALVNQGGVVNVGLEAPSGSSKSGTGHVAVAVGSGLSAARSQSSHRSQADHEIHSAQSQDVSPEQRALSAHGVEQSNKYRRKLTRTMGDMQLGSPRREFVETQFNMDFKTGYFAVKEHGLFAGIEGDSEAEKLIRWKAKLASYRLIKSSETSATTTNTKVTAI